jgi:hypothetical protein
MYRITRYVHKDAVCYLHGCSIRQVQVQADPFTMFVTKKYRLSFSSALRTVKVCKFDTQKVFFDDILKLFRARFSLIRFTPFYRSSNKIQLAM